MHHENLISHWYCFNSDPCICQTACTDTNELLYATSFSWYLPQRAAAGSPQLLKPLSSAAEKTALHSPAPRSHLEGALCIHHSKVVFPPSSHKRWKVHLFRNRLQWALAYLGKLPIHHRRVEFSRHECLFYEHLHSMNAQSKKFISVRIVHMGNTLYLQGKEHEMQNSTKA